MSTPEEIAATREIIEGLMKKAVPVLKPYLILLAARWRPVSKYGDFLGFAEDLKKKVEEVGGVFISASHRPVGVRFTFKDRKEVITFYMNGQRDIKWAVLK